MGDALPPGRRVTRHDTGEPPCPDRTSLSDASNGRTKMRSRMPEPATSIPPEARGAPPLDRATLVVGTLASGREGAGRRG